MPMISCEDNKMTRIQANCNNLSLGPLAILSFNDFFAMSQRPEARAPMSPERAAVLQVHTGPDFRADILGTNEQPSRKQLVKRWQRSGPRGAKGSIRLPPLFQRLDPRLPLAVYAKPQQRRNR